MVVASFILVILSAGIFGALIQTRKLTEGSIRQNSANTIIQGYVEQIKNMELSELPYITKAGTLMPGVIAGSPAVLQTRSATQVSDPSDPTKLINQADPFTISTSTAIPALSAILSMTPPAGVTDNIKIFDINNTPDIASDDLRLRIWIWINDMTDTSVDATRVRGITIIYAWRAVGAPDKHSFVGSVRTIRSAVPTF